MNIFLQADLSVKIGDFGLSKPLEEAVRQAETLLPTPSAVAMAGGRSARKAKKRNSNTTGVGSPLYCSPEQRTGRRYTEKVDIFSLGIIYVELLHVFSTQMERYRVLSEARRGRLPDLPMEERKFCQWLLREDPKQRPSAEDILNSEHMQLRDIVSPAIGASSPQFAALPTPVRDTRSDSTELPQSTDSDQPMATPVAGIVSRHASL